MEKNKINEITKRLSEVSITMSRVPIDTKKEFIRLANAEFEGDYGMCFNFLFQQAMEYQAIKSLFFDKLQNMEDKLDTLLNKETEQKQEPKTIKTVGGRRIELKGGKENE